MKKMLIALGVLGLSASIPHVAHAMECCEDGTCTCCKPEDVTTAPAPESHDHH